MKLILKAQISSPIGGPILEFFEKDPRFNVEDNLLPGVAFIENKMEGNYLDGSLSVGDDKLLYFSIEVGELNFNYGILATQLIEEISNLVKQINEGRLEKLPELADAITTFREQAYKEGNYWKPEPL